MIAYWAHPRVSGENNQTRAVGRVTTGSSPRERGKPARAIRTVAGARLIPA